MTPSNPRPALPDVCKQLIFAMSSVIYDGGKRELPLWVLYWRVNCDPSGTRRDVNGTLICDSVGGQCECKSNVIVRDATAVHQDRLGLDHKVAVVGETKQNAVQAQ
ncbi:hypothetical protein OS493_031718 [Desmophyllum pertusum]|uniref:Uncharacterized protein n=1 Tax=Desmophyllum pertusum TaxID=174260 RepID=A0A9W9ZJP5_9CNID|nr:hypothetical protein OS493_031718 [Desmophyllum pertusum]